MCKQIERRLQRLCGGIIYSAPTEYRDGTPAALCINEYDAIFTQNSARLISTVPGHFKFYFLFRFETALCLTTSL